MPNVLPSDARMVMGRLVDAYTACQAEQGRVIDALYGILSGRDKGLKVSLTPLSILDLPLYAHMY